jgi:hypothetical protein
MKKNVLIAALGLVSFAATAQTNKMVYVMTDVKAEGYGWNMLRTVNVNDKTTSNVLINGGDFTAASFDAVTKKQITDFPKDPRFGSDIYKPNFGYGVAAMAVDAKHNRLYFVPMRIDELRYVDLSDNKVYHLQGTGFTGVGNFPGDEGKVITRMTVSDNGDIYALSNDASQFLKISTKKNKVTVVGALTDDAANAAKNISIKNQTTSWGGDMIADDRGNLYVITMHKHVFKIDQKKLTALFIGTISNLPASFTTNGAAVLEDGKTILLSSATNVSAYYTVSIENNWEATKLEGSTAAYHGSDLATQYVLTTAKGKFIEGPKPVEFSVVKTIAAFPNPVPSTGAFRVQIKDVPAGNYIIEVTDLNGKNYITKKVAVSGKNQLENLQFSQLANAGQYYLRLVNDKKQIVGNDKLIVE